MLHSPNAFANLITDSESPVVRAFSITVEWNLQRDIQIAGLAGNAHSWKTRNEIFDLKTREADYEVKYDVK